jgi:hypothetical protein
VKLKKNFFILFSILFFIFKWKLKKHYIIDFVFNSDGSKIKHIEENKIAIIKNKTMNKGVTTKSMKVPKYFENFLILKGDYLAIY